MSGPCWSSRALQTSSSRLGHAPGILMRLCQAGASGGAGSAARPWGAAPAAPRHSPHRQRVSSTVTARRCRDRAKTPSAQQEEGEETEASPDPEHDRHVHAGSCHTLSTHHSPMPTTQPHHGNLFWSPQAPQQLLLVTHATLVPGDNVLLLCADTHTGTAQPCTSPAPGTAPGPSSAPDPRPCRVPSLPCPVPAVPSGAQSPGSHT